ncbi:MAG: hypothetical protein CFE21_10285 [Bacteroidetes bacterium B1(2017)]|nr:MAG: hypothetical protein CFE21_10285 [Bacteroidetes bacterium B1(2017)]
MAMNIQKMLLANLVAAISFNAQAQSAKDKFFQQVGFTVLADAYVTPAKDLSATYITVETSSTHVAVKGITQLNEASIGAVYYIPRFNFKEMNNENSLSVEIPIGLHLSAGKKTFNFDYVDPSNSVTYTKSYEQEYVGSLSFPIYFTYKHGLGSTYSSEELNGYSFGLGLDNRVFGISDAGNPPFESIPTFSSFSSMPSILIGYSYWGTKNAMEIKLKLSYMPSSNSNSHLGIEFPSNVGMAGSLTLNKYLNF